MFGFGGMVLGNCRLCSKAGVELQHSHILPKFAWDWLKETSVGAIRSGEMPNVRVQDGRKEYLLCRSCEGIFSRDEKIFAEQIFTPVHAGGSISGLRYTEWAMRFAVSVSWRVLIFNIDLAGPVEHFSTHKVEAASAAERQWRAFLLGQAPHVGQYEQHLVVLDLIDGHTTPGLSPFINRYIARVNDIDVIASRVSALTYAKLGKILIFGAIEDRSREWKGTRLKVKRGDFNERWPRLPGSLLPYLNDKADRAKRSLESLSPRQRAKAQAPIWETPERVANSLAFEAMMYDVELSGDAAFPPKDRKQ
jgi:hypothetical protein